MTDEEKAVQYDLLVAELMTIGLRVDEFVWVDDALLAEAEKLPMLAAIARVSERQEGIG